jgi:hypothetical protein
LKVSPEELAARDSLNEFIKKYGTLDDTIKAVGQQYALLGKSGTDAQHDLQAALDASHVSAEAEASALAKINGVLDASKQRQQDVADALTALPGAFSAVVAGTADTVKGYDAIRQAVDDAAEAQKKALDAGDISGAQKAAQTMEAAIDKQRQAADGAKQSLSDLGLQATTTFAAELAAGKSIPDAFKDIGPALSTIQQSYADLGLDVDDVALKNLLMQNTILNGNPQVIGAISGLSSEMEALDKLGVINADTLGALERTGFNTYTTLQGQVAALGGTSKDALIPMQQYLHDAQDEADKLGIPLDANTQLLIDQSTELGIWKKEGTDSTKAITDSVHDLVDTMKSLIERIAGTGGITDVINRIPRNVDVDVNATYHPPDIPGAGSPDGASTGGLVTTRGIQHFAVGGFVPQGTDTVPAMLTPGELVLNFSQQRAIGALLDSSLAAGLGRGREDGLADELKDMHRSIKQLVRYQKQDLHKALGRAVRDEVGKVRRVR